MHASNSKIASLVATPLTLLCFAGAANAQSVVYNDSASFLPNITPGYYLEDFSSGVFSGKMFTGGGFIYTVSAVNGLIAVNGGISTILQTDSISIGFTGAPVTAIGGNFFDTNILGNFIPGGITVGLSDGTSVTFSPSASTEFKGFTTASGSIASLSITAVQGGDNNFPTLDNFYVGNFTGATVGTVPEPGSLALLAGVAVSGAGFVLKRRKK